MVVLRERKVQSLQNLFWKDIHADGAGVQGDVLTLPCHPAVGPEWPSGAGWESMAGRGVLWEQGEVAGGCVWRMYTAQLTRKGPSCDVESRVPPTR